MIDVRPADAADLWAINTVISAAKRTWNYDPGYLAAALPLLSVDESYLAKNTGFAASGPDGVVGFAAIELVGDGVALLGHLWVAPVVQHRGIGTLLFRRSIAEAARSSSVLRIISDPPAEPFYLRQGAIRVGEKPSRVPGGPIFPVLELSLSHRDA
jgi:predicted N-acetyltransferase YhbS